MDKFKFPDEQPKPDVEDKQDDIEVSVEGAEDADPEIVVLDDTPPQDRGRKPIGKTPEELAPDAEVEEYSAGVKKRISELTHTYHDERRAKEASQRERDEALKLARNVWEENKKLREQAEGYQKTGNDAKKEAAEKELLTAQRDLKAAYESGDSDAVVKATEAVADAKLKINEAVNFRPAPLQREETAVQTPQQAPVPQPDERAAAWFRTNGTWFGKDEEMTSFALGLHQKLVNNGLDPRTNPDTYYERLDARIREKFPEAFEGEAPTESTDEKPRRTSPATVVAPASRTTAPKRIVLSKSQEAIARSLGVPLKEYARQMRMINESEPKRNGQ